MHEFVSVTLSWFQEGSLHYAAGAAAVLAAVAFDQKWPTCDRLCSSAKNAQQPQRDTHTHTAIHTHTWSNISSHIQRIVSSFLPLLQFRETQTGFHPRRAAADFSFHFITTAKLLEKRENTELPLVRSPFPTDCSFGKCSVWFRISNNNLGKKLEKHANLSLETQSNQIY